MAGIRVLIVDDSVVIRKVLGEALASDPEIEVVGGAADGSIALAKIPLLKPDLITLDVEMPGMTGLETLIAIRKVQPKLLVIMFSTLTERGAAITLEALALGASDYLTKPNTGSLEQTRLRIRQELIPKVKELCKRRMGAKSVPGPQLEPVKIPIAKRNLPPARVDVVTIGSSTGGPNALATVLAALTVNYLRRKIDAPAAFPPTSCITIPISGILTTSVLQETLN